MRRKTVENWLSFSLQNRTQVIIDNFTLPKQLLAAMQSLEKDYTDGQTNIGTLYGPPHFARKRNKGRRITTSPTINMTFQCYW
jgi:hypothetical protein